MKFQYQFSWNPEFKSSNTTKTLSHHFASNKFRGLILGSFSAFISVVSEHNDSLVGTAKFFCNNLLLQKCFLIKATQAYFPTSLSGVVLKDNLAKWV